MNRQRRVRIWTGTAIAMVLASLAPLLIGVVAAVRGGIDPHTALYILHVQNGATEHRSLGLTYIGAAGHGLLLGEFVVVLSALVLSLLRKSALRRLGLLILCAWSGLWTANAFVAATLGGWWMFWLIAVATLGFAACMFYCAMLRWQPRSPLF